MGAGPKIEEALDHDIDQKIFFFFFWKSVQVLYDIEFTLIKLI